MRRVLLQLLAILLVISLGIGSVAAFYQPAPSVRDQTQQGNDSAGRTSNRSTPDAPSGASGNGVPGESAVINPNVFCFSNEVNSQINQSIDSVQRVQSYIKIVFDKTVPEEFSKIGAGDVFFIDGSAETPLREPYFGKIVSMEKTSSGAELVCETPAIEEVFDQFDLDLQETIVEENVQNIQTIPGVTVHMNESLDMVDLTLESQKQNQQTGIVLPDTIAVTKLSERNTNKPSVVPLSETDVAVTEGLSMVVEFEDVDLGKGFNLISEEKGSSKKVPFANDYEKKFGKTDDDKEDDKTMLTMSGKVGLDNIRIRSNIDCSVAYDTYVRDLAIGASADFVANVTVDYRLLNCEIGGAETEVKIGNWLKLQGLKKKTFPVAYFDVASKKMMTLSKETDKQAFDVLTKLPLSLGVMLYSDFEGNLTIGAKLEWSMRKQVDSGDFVFVRDGKWVGKSIANDTLDSTPECNWAISVGVEADARFDAIGVSAQVYVCNLNVIEIDFFKLGAECEGKVGFTIGSDTKEMSDALTLEGYARVYLKLLNIEAGFKVNIQTMFFKTGLDNGFEWVLFDMTLYECGEKNDTNFDRSSMQYTQLVARDKKYTFYKDLNGYLIRATNDGGRLTISKDAFFSICGIDESYLYVLKNADQSGVYNIYRIAKDGTSSRNIVSNVLWVLHSDKTSIYYVPEFNASSISRINRNTLADENIATFDDPVQMMDKLDNDFLICCTGLYSVFGSSNTYYRLSADGKTKTPLGENLTPENFAQRMYGDTKVLVQPAGNGYLRSIAKNLYVVPKNQSDIVLTEYVSGWNPQEAGTFTTLNSNNESDKPYEIVFYSAETGVRQHVANVYSNQAFFTMCKDTFGHWYYFDQTDTELILYKMDNNFQNQTILESFSRDEIRYNLTDCSMVLFDDRVYFYSIPDGQSSIMLYRYSIFE